MSQKLNITTAVLRPGKATRYEFAGVDYPFLLAIQGATAALHQDLVNAGVQRGLPSAPPDDGANDQNLELSVTVTKEDGSPHHSHVIRYEGLPKNGVDVVMSKLAHHMAPFKPLAKIHRGRY
jgi:hypothetical protein